MVRSEWLVALAVSAVFWGGPVLAQVNVDGASFVAETTEKPGCKAAVLHILRSGDHLSGVVFFKDGSGISSVDGTSTGDRFSWTMIAVKDHGPTGNVTGTADADGSLKAKLVGTNCTLETVVPRYRDVYNGSG